MIETSRTLTFSVHRVMRDATERAIIPRYRRLASGEVNEKSAGEFVTIADHEAEAQLAEGLAALMPGVAIVGEEAAHDDPTVLERLSGDCWIVDPLDGTHNFAHGREPFGILVALASGGVTQAGWIYDCLTGRLCHARRGKGAFVNGEKITARDTGEIPPVAAISLIFMDPGRRARVTEHVAPHYRMVDIPRCAAEQYPRLALGTNDFALFERTLPWDHAAGDLWLNEAGGKCARPDGSAYRVDQWYRPGLVGAASPGLWEDAAALLSNLD